MKKRTQADSVLELIRTFVFDIDLLAGMGLTVVNG